MPRVFVSYVKDDNVSVTRLCRALTESGIDVWRDRDSIKPGTPWRDAIREAIDAGDYFLACFSRRSVSKVKSYMNEELRLAVEQLALYRPGHAWFIPVLLEDCDVPPIQIAGGQTLQDLQWVNLFDFGLRRIIETIAPSVPSPPPDGLGGTWQGKSGRLKLSQVGDKIQGQYDWNGFNWVGQLEGEFDGTVLRFHWTWDLSDERGVGYFSLDPSGAHLAGGWIFGDDASVLERAIAGHPTRDFNAWIYRRSADPDDGRAAARG